MLPKVLLTGASGLFGSNMLRLAQSRYALHGLYNRNPVFAPGVHTESVALTDSVATLTLLTRIQPEIIIHAAADANIDHCEVDHALALRNNVEVPRLLANYAAQNNVYFVQFSTDAFFEGSGRLFSEEDSPTPLSYYGETKLLAEEAIRAVPPASLIIRTNFFGWNLRDGLGLGEWILSRLRREEVLPLFNDVCFSPILVNFLAEILFDLIQQRATGLLNVAGSDPLTKLEFGRKIAEAFELNPKFILPTSLDTAGLRARRSHAMALDVTKLQALFPNRDLSIQRGIQTFRECLENGYVQALKS